MKKFYSMIVLLTLFAFSLSAQTASEVMDKARTQTSVKSVISRAEVNIQQPAGTTIEILSLDQYSGKNDKGLQSTMIIFKGPAKHKGTRFLMIERKNGSNDQRVFLPSLGKSRRIASESEGSSAFFGTDFSYNDMSFMTRSVALDTHTFLPEETYKGEACYVIESVPNDKSETYSKSVCRVTKATNRLLTAEFFNKEGKAIKLIEFLDYKKIDTIMTPMNVKMTTYSTNTSTVISIKDIIYGKKIPAKIFSIRFLETGR